MPNNTIAPAIDSSKFNWPRRSVIGSQAWINTYADRISNHEKLFRLSAPAWCALATT